QTLTKSQSPRIGQTPARGRPGFLAVDRSGLEGARCRRYRGRQSGRGDRRQQRRHLRRARDRHQRARQAALRAFRAGRRDNEGTVRLKLSPEQVEGLDEYLEPATTAQIEADNKGGTGAGISGELRKLEGKT